MPVHSESLFLLVAAADAAYQTYRRDVVDPLASGDPLDGPGLTPHQRFVAGRLWLAERELAEYREARYVAQPARLAA